MIFINPSMFTGDRHIPNLDEKCVKDYEIYKLLAKWEISGLEMSLGKCLLDNLRSQLEIKTNEDNGEQYYGLKESADEKWGWLINGRSYTSEDLGVSDFQNLQKYGCGCAPQGCSTHIWEGFVTTTTLLIEGVETTFQESFLADYVYYNWSFFNESRTTGVGQQVPKSKNSSFVTNKPERTEAFNSFWAKVKKCSFGGRVGLHGFLKEHTELFQDFQENHFNAINLWDV